METLIDMRLENLLETDIPYKDMYADVKELIRSI